MRHRYAVLTLVAVFCSLPLLHAQTGVMLKEGGDGVTVGVHYTSSNFTEFLWGLSRPLHLWNRDPASGRKEYLPFWLHPLREGGLLCWVTPGAWRRNPSLTAGTLVSEVAIIAIAASGGGGGGGSSDSGSAASPEPHSVTTASPRR